jgi:hypothetical protein
MDTTTINNRNAFNEKTAMHSTAANSATRTTNTITTTTTTPDTNNATITTTNANNKHNNYNNDPTHRLRGNDNQQLQQASITQHASNHVMTRNN